MKNVFWFLPGDERNASVRLQSVRLHKLLILQGCNSYVKQKPDGYSEKLKLDLDSLNHFSKKITKPNDVVALHKLKCERTILFIEALKSINVSVVLFDCDIPVFSKGATVLDN